MEGSGSVSLVPRHEPDEPLDRAFARIGDAYQLVAKVRDEDAEKLHDDLLDQKLASAARTVVAAGDRLAQMRVEARARGTWLEEVDRSAEL